MLNIIKEVLDIFKDNNFDAYIVGGFVRDYYLGFISSDIDICTNARIKDIKRLFKQVESIDEKYGFVTINHKNINFEITIFRKELEYKNNRKANKIVYVNTLKEDLLRRDFTINTLCLDNNLTIIDIFNAKEDIDNKIIKCIGSPHDKIKEDSLRILRAIRLATILKFNIDNDLKDAIIKNKALLKHLSYERKKEELDKIFNSQNNEYGISLLLELDMCSELELLNLNNIIIVPNSIAIWAQLDTSDKYFTRNEKRDITIIKKLLRLNSIDDYILYKYQYSFIKILCDINKVNFDMYQKRYNNLPIKSKKDIHINFDHLKNLLPMSDNKIIGQIYDEIEILIVENKLNNNFCDIKSYVLNKYK